MTFDPLERLKACASSSLKMTPLQAMRTPPVDAIVLDINMPGGSGEDTLRKLKMSTRTSAIPVIILRGSIDAAGQERVRSNGAAAVLSKPLVPEELFQALDAAL
jgi:CheY-like chemotaxis protein